MKLAAPPTVLPSARRTMKAAVLEAPRKFTMLDVPLQEPMGSQVRVRLEGCGLCASNLPPWEGRPWFQYPMRPGALGHEGWGRIDALGPLCTDLQIGQRVAVLSQHAFAEYDLAEEADLIPLPSDLNEEAFPGEPLGCAMNIFRRCDIQKDDKVAIIGSGFIGALLVQLAHAAGARVIALSRRRSALALASQLGAEATDLFDDHQRVLARVADFTSGKWCDVVIEATGKQGPLDLAGEITCERGRLVIAGYHQDGLRTVNLQLWNWRGLDVINAHERDPRIYVQGIQQAVEAVRAGLLTPAPLLTHRFPLQNINEAFELAAQRPEGFIKAILRNDSSRT